MEQLDPDDFANAMGLLSALNMLSGTAPWSFNNQTSPDKLREVRASECFDKEELIRAHKQLFTQEKVRPNKLRRHQYSTVTEPCRPSASRLDSLQRMCITQLKESHGPAAGRLVIGELCVDAGKMVSVQTIIEDINAPAGKAARLCIYNVAAPAEQLSHVQRMYPKGMRLAIKEPYFKRCKDGGLSIRVDNPADLVEITPHNDPSIIGTSLRNLSLHGGPSQKCINRRLEIARDCRKCGNDLFKVEDWKAAARQYTRAISAALVRDQLVSNGDSRGKSPDQNACDLEIKDPDLKGELVMAYSNRSETQLRLKYYERAVADAHRALQLDPTHLKCLFRKGVALLSLHSYTEAVACLNEAVRVDPKNADLKSALQHASDLKQQCSSGKGYNLRKLFEDACSHNSDSEGGKTPSKQMHQRWRGSPSCAEYVGLPVEIRLVSNSSTYRVNMQQRGLFTKKDVKCGELLLVSIATGLCTHIEAAGCINEERSTVSFIFLENQRTISRPEEEHLILELTERARNSQRLTQQLRTLAAQTAIAAGRVHEVPKMELFRPDTITAKECLQQEEELEGILSTDVDVDGIRAVVGTNAFCHCPHSGTGTWMLPSFMNHACNPNTSFMIVKDAMFVRAARDMSAGEELTTSYIDVMKPLKMRRQNIMKGWSFECKCQRCRWEEAMMSKKPYAHILESLTSSYERTWQEKEAQLASSGTEIQLAEMRRLAAGQRRWEMMSAEEYKRYRSFAEIAEEVEKLVQRYNGVDADEAARGGSGRLRFDAKKDEWKGWLRASYAKSYWRAFGLLNEGDETLFLQQQAVAGERGQKVAALQKEVVAAVRKAVPGVSEALLVDLHQGLLDVHGPICEELLKMGFAAYGCHHSPSELTALLSLRSDLVISPPIRLVSH